MGAIAEGRGWLREQAGFPVTAVWGPAHPCPVAVKVGSLSEPPPTTDFWKEV